MDGFVCVYRTIFLFHIRHIYSHQKVERRRRDITCRTFLFFFFSFLLSKLSSRPTAKIKQWLIASNAHSRTAQGQPQNWCLQFKTYGWLNEWVSNRWTNFLRAKIQRAKFAHRHTVLRSKIAIKNRKKKKRFDGLRIVCNIQFLFSVNVTTSVYSNDFLGNGTLSLAKRKLCKCWEYNLFQNAFYLCSYQNVPQTRDTIIVMPTHCVLHIQIAHSNSNHSV